MTAGSAAPPQAGPASGRLAWVDTGRGLAISLVALYHAGNWLAKTPLDVEQWRDASAVLSSLRMPLFFVLAGLFAPKWLDADWRSLVRSKTLLFWWVFLVWTTIGTLVYPLGLAAGGQRVGLRDQVEGLLLAPVLPRFELWFIWALSLFFLLAKAVRRVAPRWQLLATGLLSAVALTVWVDTTTGWTGAAKFLFFFLLGVHGGRPMTAFAARVRPLTGALVLLVWAVWAVALQVTGLQAVPGLYFLDCLLGVLAGVVVARALSRVRWLGRIGRQTLPIYLAHTPLLLVLTFLVSREPLVDALAPVGWLVPPVVAALAVVSSLGLHRLVQGAGAGWVYAPPARLVRWLGGPGRQQVDRPSAA